MIWIRLFVPVLLARGVIVIVGAPLFGPSCALSWWMWPKFCVGWNPAGSLNFHSRICHSSQLPCTFAQVELLVIDFISLRWRSTVLELQRSPSITGSMWMSKRNAGRPEKASTSTAPCTPSMCPPWPPVQFGCSV